MLDKARSASIRRVSLIYSLCVSTMEPPAVGYCTFSVDYFMQFLDITLLLPNRHCLPGRILLTTFLKAKEQALTSPVMKCKRFLLATYSQKVVKRIMPFDSGQQ